MAGCCNAALRNRSLGAGVSYVSVPLWEKERYFAAASAASVAGFPYVYIACPQADPLCSVTCGERAWTGWQAMWTACPCPCYP